MEAGRYSLRFDAFDTAIDLVTEMGAEEAARTEIAVGAVLQLTDLESGDHEVLRPIYAIRGDRSVHYVPARGQALTAYFKSMDVNSGAINLALEGIDGPDYVVVQAYEKPAISLVWIGLIMLTGGFFLSVARRAGEVNFRRRRASRAQ